MKKAVYFHILLVCTLFSTNSKGQAGDSIFYSDQIHDIQITFWQPGFWDSLTANYALDKMMACAMTWNGQQFDSVGIQLKGNSSYNSYPGVKKPMNIQFNEYISGQKLNGLKKINFNNGFKDPTMLREKIMLDFCEDKGIPAPRCTFGKVYINGTYWGFYNVVEQVDRPWLERKFSGNEGNLFKGDPHGDLKWLGSMESNYYPHYELKTNEVLNDWSDLVHLIDEINNTPTNNFKDSVDAVLDADIAIKAWAANILFANLDSYPGSGHNYYIYHDSITGLFKWINWDVNEAFGNFTMGMNLNQIQTLSAFFVPTNPPGGRPLVTKMLADVNYRSTYVNTLCDWLNNDFSIWLMEPKIDSLAAKIQADYFADPNKMYSNAQFTTNLQSAVNATPGLKDFINARRDFLSGELVSEGCVVAMNPIVNSLQAATVFPNPVDEISTLTISFPENISNASLKIVDVLGREVNSFGLEFFPGKILIQASMGSKGIYFFHLLSEGKIVSSGKFIVIGL